MSVDANDKTGRVEFPKIGSAVTALLRRRLLLLAPRYIIAAHVFPRCRGSAASRRGRAELKFTETILGKTKTKREPESKWRIKYASGLDVERDQGSAGGRSGEGHLRLPFLVPFALASLPLSFRFFRGGIR